jgi:hypothetical protein
VVVPAAGFFITFLSLTFFPSAVSFFFAGADVVAGDEADAASVSVIRGI